MSGARIAVYDRYWSTAGGGEKFAAGVASVLRPDHEVTLLAHEPVDTDWLGERLSLDLAGTAVQIVGDAGHVTAASAAHDLLVNLSYRSSDRNGARRGLYVVHFPHAPDVDVPPKQRLLLRTLGPVLGRAAPPYTFGPGFHDPDVVRAAKVRWTDGDGEVQVPLAPGTTTTVHLLFGRLLPAARTDEAQVDVDGRPAGSVAIGPPRSKAEVLVPAHLAVPITGHDDGSPVRLRVRSGSWRPADLLGNGDGRRLGVPLTGVAVGGSAGAWLRAGASLFEAFPLGVEWVDSYDRILANSVFTQRWIQRYWARDSDVLYPPVSLRADHLTPQPTSALSRGHPLTDPQPKSPVVLSVGRFFAAERGHSKKQLELVEAWRRLLDRPAARAVIDREGWSLHLVGGCREADRPYLDEVRHAAENLPVVVHVDAPGDELDALYRQASIYWHGAGFGEDPDAHPERMEHFGITTVEAMSAGAVPLAFAAAGPLEAFRHAVEGFHFRALDELAGYTETLLTDPDRRARLARAAMDRAEQFGLVAFGERVHALVDAVLA